MKRKTWREVLGSIWKDYNGICKLSSREGKGKIESNVQLELELKPAQMRGTAQVSASCEKVKLLRELSCTWWRGWFLSTKRVDISEHYERLTRILVADGDELQDVADVE
jgi:hypothetical protein